MIGYCSLGDFCICTSYSNQKGVLGLVPEVLLLRNYSVAFYMIFRHISQNLLVLRGHLTIIEDEERPTMHDVLQKKLKMFKYVPSP
ncbi:hypothetical protein J5N97_030044 [Dioscorea zingiberensis]|uniref:Uncharacterized protein n=1 Tax=Dioscorea zingiberensis TaxID=325984 RepID=A0A9D5BX84_9LILI|nr:hypothetical protein J5N97_030044 [Dioscorea zingiberensis]